MRMRPMILAAALFACALCAGPSLVHAECVTIKYRDTPVCLNTFACTETPQSSYVREVCFDAAKSYMLIKLNDTWYHHCAVDRASVENLIQAPSVGTYYDQNFRSNGPMHRPFDCRDHPVPEYSQEPDTNTLAAKPGSAPEVPGCRDAWNDLDARAALGYARILIETDCPVMYRQGWLINPQRLSSDVIPACVVAWNALVSRGALSSARFLVMHNCPVIERKGWR